MATLQGSWSGGYLRAPDDLILEVAYEDRRVLITRDKNTIPPLLMEWAETGRHHAGVILVPEQAFRRGGVGGLLRSILQIEEASGDDDWEDRVMYLPSA